VQEGRPRQLLSGVAATAAAAGQPAAAGAEGSTTIKRQLFSGDASPAAGGAAGEGQPAAAGAGEGAPKEKVKGTAAAVPVAGPPESSHGFASDQFASQQAAEAQAEEMTRTDREREMQPAQSGDVIVWLGYKKTWKNAGQALISCSSGCTCKPVKVEAYHKWQTTQSFMAKLYTQQVEVCTVTVKVLNETNSGGHHFKVSGAMITRRIAEYDGGDHTDVLLLNAIEGHEFKG